MTHPLLSTSDSLASPPPLLCSIFNPFLHPISLCLHLLCPSPTLWIYKDRHFIPFAFRFSFLEQNTPFSSATVSGSQTRTYTPTYLWSPLSFSVFLPQNLFAPCMYATLLTVSLSLLSCHLYTVKRHSLSETAPHTVDVNWIQGHSSSLNYTD